MSTGVEILMQSKLYTQLSLYNALLSLRRMRYSAYITLSIYSSPPSLPKISISKARLLLAGI